MGYSTCRFCLRVPKLSLRGIRAVAPRSLRPITPNRSQGSGLKTQGSQMRAHGTEQGLVSDRGGIGIAEHSHSVTARLVYRDISINNEEHWRCGRVKLKAESLVWVALLRYVPSAAGVRCTSLCTCRIVAGPDRQNAVPETKAVSKNFVGESGQNSTIANT